MPSTVDQKSEKTEKETDSTQNTHQTSRPLPPLIEIEKPQLGQSVSHDLLLGRWRLSLDLFGRVFMEDVGIEPGSVVSELGGFPVKEAKFRRDMEKLRNIQQKDLTFSKVSYTFFNIFKALFQQYLSICLINTILNS